ncbi:MAG: hypothetical protein ABJB16_03515 [Saprospiraceae bacterium]
MIESNQAGDLNHFSGTRMRSILKGEGGQVLISNGKTLVAARRKKEEFMKAIGY